MPPNDTYVSKLIELVEKTVNAFGEVKGYIKLQNQDHESKHDAIVEKLTTQHEQAIEHLSALKKKQEDDRNMYYKMTLMWASIQAAATVLAIAFFKG